MPTIELERARHVLGWAARMTAANAKKAPAMVRHNGLAQTVAFWKEKQGEWSELLEKLGDWLLRSKEQVVVEGLRGGDLLAALVAADTDTYRLATGEALAYLGWVKRLARGEKEVK
jgi:CRISPR type III-B/RAMP module-associated protein Cmr5